MIPLLDNISSYRAYRLSYQAAFSFFGRLELIVAADMLDRFITMHKLHRCANIHIPCGSAKLCPDYGTFI